ncbi:olfactory receptor 11H6-like [Girardinichthys multiradiatus]|uniref:olfactory receptor 11H6-like n=1 Tax=Girardinichthys multiradiatus TaxID=208333 RepID=UPI001FAB8FE8|nr:olfactory receptor 11H6-like [Girardinichthys multiradiatus]XP_047227422.1 olfactory receptor 11H6-like [Girardinichthys multiradiatus]
MNNVSTVSVFFLSGLNETRNYRAPLFFLSLMCYFVIILVNVCVILTIILDNELHEPMYILLCAFCMNSLYGTAGFYPKFLWDLLSPVHVISYSGCLLQNQVLYSSACSELSILALTAYDRYLAICRPLEYHSVMPKQRAITSVCLTWLIPFCLMAVNTFLTSRLKLCSPHLNRLICLNWSIVMLACFPAETTVNSIVGNLTIAIYVLHIVVILWSYIFLIKTCLGSLENRRKFMQTCVPHLISLFTFSVIILFDILYIQFESKNLPQTLKYFVSIEFLIIPPIMNPLIYGFKLTKIRNKIVATMKIK